MAQWQEKGGEPNSLFGLILFRNICGGSNPRGEKKKSSYFGRHSKDIKREQIFPVKGGRHKLAHICTTLQTYNLLEL